MATVYTKTTGTATNGQDLLTKLSTFLTANGFTLEFSGDNIISTVNLGKKFIFSKSSIYYYFAASDNNNPTGNDNTYISKGVSGFGATIAKTLNTTNNWMLNNPQSDVVMCENKALSNYFFYVNGDNIIIVIKWAANQYSYMYLGPVQNLQAGSEAILATGSSTSALSSGSSVTKMPIYPLFNPTVTFGWFDGVYIRRNATSIPMILSNVSSSNGNNQVPNLTGNNGNSQMLNKTDNPLNGVSVMWDFKLYKQAVSTLTWFSLARVLNIYLVNFANLVPEQQYIIGSRKYDVFPFLQKETPQNYNVESMGMGFAIKTDE